MTCRRASDAPRSPGWPGILAARLFSLGHRRPGRRQNARGRLRRARSTLLWGRGGGGGSVFLWGASCDARTQHCFWGEGAAAALFFFGALRVI